MSDKRQLDGRHDAVMGVLAIIVTLIATVMTVGLTALGVTMTLHWWGG